MNGDEQGELDQLDRRLRRHARSIDRRLDELSPGAVESPAATVPSARRRVVPAVAAALVAVAVVAVGVLAVTQRGEDSVEVGAGSATTPAAGPEAGSSRGTAPAPATSTSIAAPTTAMPFGEPPADDVDEGLVQAVAEVTRAAPATFVGTYVEARPTGGRTLVVVASAGSEAAAAQALGELLGDPRVRLEACDTTADELARLSTEVQRLVGDRLDKPFGVSIDASACAVELSLSEGDVPAEVVRTWFEDSGPVVVVQLPGEITPYGEAP